MPLIRCHRDCIGRDVESRLGPGQHVPHGFRVSFSSIANGHGWDSAEKVADRFNHSYTPDASAPVYPDSPERDPTIKLIEKYSRQKLRADRQPGTIARMQASLSTQDAYSGTEWTAPSTPIVVIYQRWPTNTGAPIPKEGAAIVGTIGDLQNWIAQSKSDFHFLVNDVFLALISVGLCVWLWIKEGHPSRANPRWRVCCAQSNRGSPSDRAWRPEL
jgi:hypothetical protein